MPELPEVERAAQHVKRHAQNKRINKVDAFEDGIVFSGTTHIKFITAITGRKVLNVRRYGKVFFLELDEEGPMPVLHFGMTGNIQVKGQPSLVYKEGVKQMDDQWPPRFCKFVLHLSGIGQSIAETTEIAFVDARRLGRIRLCAQPMQEPPISALGFDPILCMPPVEDFSRKVLARACAIKALLLDQSFSAGVGNWIADEILYQARIHPEQRSNSLTEAQIQLLHEKMRHVCQTAVSVNADHTKFPEDWLFLHRWGKGKQKAKKELMLPSGQPATIKWLTAGGRTSAIVVELQRKTAMKEKEDQDDEESRTRSKTTETKQLKRTRSRRTASASESRDEETTSMHKRSRRRQ